MRSLRISKPDRNRKIPLRTAIILFIMTMLFLATYEIHNYIFNFPLHYLLLLLDVFGVLCIRHLSDLEYGMDFLPFIAVLAITLVFQSLLAGPYFSFSSALSMVILLFAMMILVMLVMQKGYAGLIWKTINFFNLFSACCILIQMAFKLVGIRLDRMGMVSNIFFNAWEFVSAFRPAGTYKEPAMFAQPALLSMAYYMFIGKNWKKALVIALALVLSTSALGLMGLVIILAVWSLNLDKLHHISRRTKWILLVATGTVITTILLFSAEANVFVVERLFSGSSIGVRALRSVDLFIEMNPVEKIIGIGLQNQALYLNHNGILLAHDTYETTFGGNREYAGTLGYILCTTGFLGLVFFVRPFYRVFTRHGVQVKVICFLFIYCTMFCAMLGYCILAIYILAVYSTVDLERSGAFRQEENHGQ